MINTKDVITMRVPYPNISSDLALDSHMYICQSKNSHHCQFIKCQRVKPYMLTRRIVNDFIDEKPDPNRNPFKSLTRIDCDKIFVSKNLLYNIKLRTKIRPDVSNDLFQSINNKLSEGNVTSIALNEKEVVILNQLISKVPAL